MKIFVSSIIINDIGGIPTSTVNFLSQISKHEDVTLCVMSNVIMPKKPLNPNIKIVKGSDYIQDSTTPLKYLSGQSFLRKLKRNVRRAIPRIIGYDNMVSIGLRDVRINEEYDIAIAYANDLYIDGKRIYGVDYDLVKSKVNAKKKIAWIHNDPYRCGFDHPLVKGLFDGFDAVVSVSYDNKKQLDAIFPQNIHKSFVVYNMYDIDSLRRLSEEYTPSFQQGKIHFVTVGRLRNEQKRIDRILKTCHRLKQEEKGDLLEWTIIGDGPDRLEYEKYIEENGISEMVRLTGVLANPYPYMKHADAFVLTSDYEGYSMVIKEAQSLGTPALITRFGPAKESVTDGENGIICDNSTEGVYEMIKEVLEQPEKLDELRKKLARNPVTNARAFNQFYLACRGDRKSVV